MKAKPLARAPLIGLCLAALMAGIVVAQAAANNQNSKAVLKNPEVDVTEGQRQRYQQRIMSQAHAANNAFLKEFEARHGDLHTLPVIEIDTYAAPPVTLSAAVQASTAIVVGTVSLVTFEVNPSRGMPLATATVHVEQVIKGMVAPILTVKQLGGPVAHGATGALAELNNDRLVLPHDHVLLMLNLDSSSLFYHTVLGAGVNEIDTSGRLVPEDSNPFATAVRGIAVADFAARVANGG